MSGGYERDPEGLAPGDEAPPGERSAGENVCPECGGSGELADGECRNCGGSGTVVEAVGGG
jgi:DnaJ-class molecular chaperone